MIATIGEIEHASKALDQGSSLFGGSPNGEKAIFKLSTLANSQHYFVPSND